jgi:hypothetical protein
VGGHPGNELALKLEFLPWPTFVDGRTSHVFLLQKGSVGVSRNPRREASGGLWSVLAGSKSGLSEEQEPECAHQLQCACWSFAAKVLARELQLASPLW